MPLLEGFLTYSDNVYEHEKAKSTLLVVTGAGYCIIIVDFKI